MNTSTTQSPDSLGSQSGYPRLRRGQCVRVRPEGFRRYFAGVVEGPCNGLYSSEDVYGVSGPAFGLTRAHVGDMILDNADVLARGESAASITTKPQ